MAMHSSLRASAKGKRVCSVLKRFERIKELLEKEKWKPGDSVFGLPKLKAVQLKLKKSKKAEEEKPAEAAAGTAQPEAEAKTKASGPAKDKKAKKEG